jgi:hypothetical protein
MKTYITPALVAKGDVVRLTQGALEGRTDPNEIGLKMPPGSVGFSL